MKKFLTAKWTDLIMANYEVEPSLLADYVPLGTELDLHDGKCFVSLVGFMFLDTRIFGLPVPFNINFEEINLRFYVARESDGEIRRGVVFIKEIVDRICVATTARFIYGENYECWIMSSHRSSDLVSYAWAKAPLMNMLETSIGDDLGEPEAGSHGEFILEHYWGYTKRGARRTDEYRVDHAEWELKTVVESLIDVDFGRTYGKNFAFLGGQDPYSMLFSKGSEVAVYKGGKIV